MSQHLEDLKNLLAIDLADTDQDDKLRWILSAAEKRLRLLLGLPASYPGVPEELSFVVVDVACIRFNRIASEGMRSDSVEGESITFYDHDFDAYRDELDAWLSRQEDDVTGGRGKVRFI